MRQNRTKTRKKTKKNKWMIWFLFLIILPLLSVSIGYFGVEYFLKLSNDPPKQTNNNVKYEEKLNENINKLQDNTNNENANKNNKPNENKEASNNTDRVEKKYSMELPAISIYNVQVGSFSDTSYAEKQIRDLRDKGLAGYILKNDGYKVITMSFLNRNEADKYKENIRDIYSDAFISPINLPIREIKYDENGKKYADVAKKEINNLISYYNSFNEFIVRNNFSTANIEEIKIFVDNQIESLKSIEDSISNLKPTDDFVKFNNNLLNIVNDSRKGLETIKQGNFSNGKNLVEVYMKGVNKYSNINY